MAFLDMQTILFSCVLTGAVCLTVVVSLWWQSRKRFDGMAFWVGGFALQTAALILITLRGIVPEGLSLISAQAMALIGTYCGYLALLRFSGQKSSQYHNYVILILLMLIAAYSIIIESNPVLRGLSLSLGLLIFYFECAWVVFYQAAKNMRSLMFGVGLVCAGFCLLNIVRAAGLFSGWQAGLNFMLPGTFDKEIMIAYSMLLILLTYTLALMVNKRLLQHIALQEEKYSKVFDSSANAINLSRLSDGVVFECNQGFKDITGYEHGDVIGKKAIELQLWQNDRDRIWMVKELLKGRPVDNLEFQFRRKSGEIITGLFSAEMITVNDEKCVLSSVKDITGRRMMENQLRASEAFTRTVMDHLPIGLAVNSIVPEVTFSYMNENFLKFYRTTRDALNRPDGFWKAVYEDPVFRENIKSRILADCAGGDPGRMYWPDIPISRKGEKTTYITAQNTPVPEKDLMISTVWDVTERKEAETFLQRSESFLESIIEQTPYAVWIADDRGTLIRINPSCLKMFNVRAEEVVGTYNIFEDNIVKEQGLMPQVRRAFYEGEPARFEISYDTAELENVNFRNAANAFLDATLFPIKDAEGRVTNVVIQYIEITDRKRAQEEIRQLNLELEKKVALRTGELRDSQAALLNLVDDLNESSQSLKAANQALEAVNKELAAFSYSVSHDLRAPLRSIEGFSSALEEDCAGKLEGENRDYLQRIRRATQTMGRLIDDMLNLSRVTQTELCCRPVNVSRIAKTILDDFKNFNPSRSVDIRIQPNIIVSADDRLINIALTNLLENAWKFTVKTPSACIELGEEIKEGEKVIFVRDNGAGFDPQYAGNLFGPFQRLHKAEDYPGTGVGLATVQRIIHRHGGKIWAEGHVGRGATFYFVLEE